VNIQQLRQSLKIQWLNYYRDNRDWLTRVGVWVTCEGERRPSSSFILATLSVLEPQLTQLLPLIVDLSSNPDRIVIALGLNFNPDEELKALETSAPSTLMNGQVKMLPSGSRRSISTSTKEIQPKEIAVPRPVFASLKAEQEPEQKSEHLEPPSAIPSIANDVPQPAPNRSTQAPIQPPSLSATSPFEAPIDLVEPAAEDLREDAHKDIHHDASDDHAPKTITMTLPTGETIVRPVMDTIELATGELPKREQENAQANAVDEACEGRQKSITRTRHD
jgi:hypothetical protein